MRITETRVQIGLALAVGVVGASVSWSKVIALATESGQTGWRAVAVAVCVETGAVSGLLEVRRRKRQEQSALFAYAVVVASGALQLAANIAHAPATFWGVTMSALPAAWFLLLSKVALGCIRDDQRRTRRSAPAGEHRSAPAARPSAPRGAPASAPAALPSASPVRPSAPVLSDAGAPAPRGSALPSAPGRSAPALPSAPRVHPDGGGVHLALVDESTPSAPARRTDEDLADQVRALDGPLSARRIARECGVGQARAGVILRLVQAPHGAPDGQGQDDGQPAGDGAPEPVPAAR